jgi:hypothetical protein
MVDAVFAGDQQIKGKGVDRQVTGPRFTAVEQGPQVFGCRGSYAWPVQSPSGKHSGGDPYT